MNDVIASVLHPFVHAARHNSITVLMNGDSLAVKLCYTPSVELYKGLGLRDDRKIMHSIRLNKFKTKENDHRKQMYRVIRFQTTTKNKFNFCLKHSQFYEMGVVWGCTNQKIRHEVHK